MNRIIKKFPSRSTFLLQLRLFNKNESHANQRTLYETFSTCPATASNVFTKRHFGKYQEHQKAFSFNNPAFLQSTKGLHIKPDTVCIRNCRESDIKSFLQLTRSAGWDNTEFDSMMALKLSPSYLIVAADDSDNPVGFVGVCEMPCNTLYAGMFIVHESARSLGIGRRLVKAAWERIGDRNVCIDAAVNLIEYYGKQGIVHESSRSNTYRGIVSSACKKFKANKTECDVVPLTEKIWSGLLQYDRNVYRGISREKILRLWFTGECVYTVVAFRNGKVSGYGSFVTAGDKEYYIKTVFGDTANVADEILDNLLDQIPVGAMLTFSILADKTVSERFTDFELTITTHRLWNKFTIKTESDKIFCICYQFI